MTIPCAALVGAGMEVLTRLPGGAAMVFILTAAIALLRSWAEPCRAAGW